MTNETLQGCALQYDPSVPHSNSGIYFLGIQLFDEPTNNRRIVIKTNLRELAVPPNDYAILKLESNESVEEYSLQTDTSSLVCTPDPSNTIPLINNPGLSAAEFVLRYFPATGSTAASCEYLEISRMERAGGIRQDVYGFFPFPSGQGCFMQPVF